MNARKSNTIRLGLQKLESRESPSTITRPQDPVRVDTGSQPVIQRMVAGSPEAKAFMAYRASFNG